MQKKDLYLRISVISIILFSLIITFVQLLVVYLCTKNSVYLENGFEKSLLSKISSTLMIRTIIKLIFVFKMVMAIIKKKPFKISILKYILILMILFSSIYDTYIYFSDIIPVIRNNSKLSMCYVIISLSIVINIALVARIVIYTFLLIDDNRENKNNSEQLEKQ